MSVAEFLTQTCNRCGENKPITAFAHQKGRPNPRRTCKVCRYSQRDREKEKKRHREYMRERRKNDPDGVRRNWERSVYGAAKEDFGYAECWVCGSDAKLCIDHNHATGAPRGLLCSNCNIGIGNMQDDIERLKRAIDYLSAPGPHWQLDERR